MSARYTFAVYETKVGSAAQKLILLKLADNSNDDGIAWPGMDYLSRHCELSKSAILRNLKSLEEKGFIQVKRRKSKDGKTNLSNVYQLLIGSSSKLVPSSSELVGGSSSELPESNNNKSNNESTDLTHRIIDMFNTVKSTENPNWTSVESRTKSRMTLMKNRINDVQKRTGSKDRQATLKWFTDYLIALSANEFYSGKPKFAGDTGYKWSFDSLFREKNFVNAIERLNDE